MLPFCALGAPTHSEACGEQEDVIGQVREHLGAAFEPMPLYAVAGTSILYDISLFHGRADATTGTERRRVWQTYYARDDSGPALG